MQQPDPTAKAAPADPVLVAEPRMDGAGMELMALSFRLEKHPEFAKDAERVREIAGWIVADKPSDIQTALIKVIGGVVGAMRERGVVFHDDQPIEAQFTAFLENMVDGRKG